MKPKITRLLPTEPSRQMMTFPALGVGFLLVNAARDKNVRRQRREPSRHPDKCEEAENESDEDRSVPNLKPIQQSAHSPMNSPG